MSAWDDPADRMARWLNGTHDDRCEQRERNWLCHCSKRRRESRGLTVPPTEDLYFPPPDCPECTGDLEFDGDLWDCPTCRLAWSSDGRASTARFTDDYGTDFGGEQFGHLMRDLRRAQVIP